MQKSSKASPSAVRVPLSYSVTDMMRLMGEGVATYLSYWNLLFALERQFGPGHSRNRPNR